MFSDGSELLQACFSSSFSPRMESDMPCERSLTRSWNQPANHGGTMKVLTVEESEHRVTLAARGNDDDGEPETDNPVVGLQILGGAPEDSRRYRFEGFGSKQGKRTLRFLIIGASSQCHIQINDERVSSVHCGLVHNFRTRRVMVHDCGSTNGLFVNGIRVHASEVDPGDTITVGNTHLYAFGKDEPQARILITASTHREFIERALATLGSERTAAEAIDVPRTTLRDWLRKDEVP
jgi:hypothetical protein